MHDTIYRAELLVVYAWLLQILRACLCLRLPSSKKADRKFTILIFHAEDIKCTIIYIVRSCSSSALGFCKYFVLASAYACRHQKKARLMRAVFIV